jgi:hypothetical protein
VARRPAAPADNGQTVILSHPPGAVQAGIAVAHDAIGSLGAQPVLLLIVIVNIVFVMAAAFFLWKLEATRSALMLSTLDIVKACVVKGVQ